MSVSEPAPSPASQPDTALDLSQFRHAISRSFVPLQVVAEPSPPFRGSVRTEGVDEIQFSLVTASSHRVERTEELISRSDRHYFKLSLQLEGTGSLLQAGREAVLGPGDIAIYDTNRPYTLNFDGPVRVMVVMFPKHVLELPPETVSQMTAVRIGAETRLSGLVAPFLGGLVDNLGLLEGQVGRRLAHSAVDLVTTIFSHEAELEHGSISPKQALLQQVMAFIDEHLGDNALGPTEIAAAHFISTRHLHQIFHEQGTTVSSWIRERRLERCRRDLTSPALAERPISAIAARWGFADPAHFSRVFKAGFGLSPTEARQRGLHGRSQ